MRNRLRKLMIISEKAGIRMLLPMIMMFGVVLVVLMVPALLGMWYI